MLKIKKENLNSLFQIISNEQELYLPIKKGNVTNFGVYDETVVVDLETLKTVKSPKDVFFPQSENLYTVVKENKKMCIKPETYQDEPFVLFGVKACDVKGFEVLDKVFLADPVDSYYAARRKHGTIVSLACGKPSSSCFCKVFNVDCTEPVADVAMWKVDDEYYLEAQSDKGNALIEKCNAVLEEVESLERLEEIKATTKKIVDKLPFSHLSLVGWKEENLNEIFNSTLWEELYKPCLACGTCTFVCPTCQCYDIKDYRANDKVIRYRCWDSCMYSDFTMMAHGNNRTTQLQRFRQRFMHKLVYYPANNDGLHSCVGCGRCVDKCPASLNIIKVIKTFNEKGGINHE